jgi:membrane fusion protein, multidrug efflux system
MRKAVWVFVLFLGLSLGVRVLCQEGETARAEPSVSVVLAPRQETVLSAEVSARVIETFGEMGEAFDKGTVLVRLDRSLFEARQEKAAAELESREVEQKAVEKLYRDRSRSLVDLMRARRALAQARMELKVAEHELSACTISAPYAGRVVKLLVREHELVQKGQELIRIVDDRLLRARFLAPSHARGRLAIGQTLALQIETIDRPVEARITHISPDRKSVV